MRKALLVVMIAFTVLAGLPTSAAAAQGTLDIRARGTGKPVTVPGDRYIDMYMLDGTGKRRCKDWGPNKITVESNAFSPTSEDDESSETGKIVLPTTVTSTLGTYKVKATCQDKGWTFTGYLKVVSPGDLPTVIALGDFPKPPELPTTGVPAHLTAALGFTLLLVGVLLLVVGHPAGRPSQVRRYVRGSR